MTDAPQPAPEAEPIPQEALDRAHRKLCRRVAAHLLAGMAEADVGFAQIASRLDAAEAAVRAWFQRLADGEGGDLREMSDMATAMGMEWSLSLRPMAPEQKPPGRGKEADDD